MRDGRLRVEENFQDTGRGWTSTIRYVDPSTTVPPRELWQALTSTYFAAEFAKLKVINFW